MRHSFKRSRASLRKPYCKCFFSLLHFHLFPKFFHSPLPKLYLRLSSSPFFSSYFFHSFRSPLCFSLLCTFHKHLRELHFYEKIKHILIYTGENMFSALVFHCACAKRPCFHFRSKICVPRTQFISLKCKNFGDSGTFKADIGLLIFAWKDLLA